MTRLAAIIVNYNGLSDTLECIKSLNSSDIDVYPIIIDNGSANSESEKLRNMFPDVKVIETGRNFGFAGANNIGIRFAISNGFTHVLLINNDTIVEKNTISTMLAKCNENCVVTCLIKYYSDKSSYWFAGGYISRLTGNSKHYTNPKKNHKKYCNFASGCCMLIPTQVIKKVGLLDDSYFMYYEDADYCIRLEEYQIPIVLETNAVIYHKVGKSSGGNQSAFSIYYLTRNRLRLVKIHKKYFFITAFLYSLISRYMRMFQLWVKKDSRWKAFRNGINDFKKGVSGESEQSNCLDDMK